MYAALLAVGLTLGLHSSGAAVNEVLNWDTGNNSQSTGLECPTASKDFSIINSPAREGGYAAKFHIDANSGLWGNGITRCMTSLYNSGEGVGSDYYYGFSIYLPAAMSDNVLWELHAPSSLYTVSGNCSLAPFGLAARSGGIDLRIDTGNCDGAWAHYEPHIQIPGLSTQPVGKWIDFVIHITFAESSTGSYNLWYRLQGNPWPSAPVVSRSGIPTMPYSNAANVHNVKLYTMFGLYPGYSGYTGNDAVIFDDFSRGGSFGDVAPADGSVSSPPPAPAPPPTTTTTTQAATTTHATTTSTTTTTPTTTKSVTTTGSTTTAAPPATTTAPTTTAAPTETTAAPTTTDSGGGGGHGHGHSKHGSDVTTDALMPRVLAAARISKPQLRSARPWVRVVRAVVSVRGARSMRVSAISARGTHRRMPLLANSTVGPVSINYWRKTVVTGPVKDGRLVLRLRIPRRLLTRSGAYTLRVRSLGPTSWHTRYLRLRFTR